jgi:hypothetical protein
MRDNDSRLVEEVLRKGGFPRTDAYRYNSASIRVRVIDPRFEGVPMERRDVLVESLLEQLPEEIQADIMNLVTLAPGEMTKRFRGWFANEEFEDPSPSML